jgi:hypothetical protein
MRSFEAKRRTEEFHAATSTQSPELGTEDVGVGVGNEEGNSELGALTLMLEDVP